MPKLTVVFNYSSKADMEQAKQMFDEQSKNGAIPNLVGTTPYDAIDKCGGYEKQEKEDDDDIGDCVFSSMGLMDEPLVVPDLKIVKKYADDDVPQ